MEEGGGAAEPLSSCLENAISITILEAFGEVKTRGVCPTESDLGAEGVFCDLSLVDAQGQAEQLGWNMSLWSEYCTD